MYQIVEHNRCVIGHGSQRNGTEEIITITFFQQKLSREEYTYDFGIGCIYQNNKIKIVWRWQYFVDNNAHFTTVQETRHKIDYIWHQIDHRIHLAHYFLITVHIFEKYNILKLVGLYHNNRFKIKLAVFCWLCTCAYIYDPKNINCKHGAKTDYCGICWWENWNKSDRFSN